MPKGGKKTGPPYLDILDCKYIVIIDPWGMSSARDRKQIDVDRVGAWIRFMLRDQGKDGKDILPEAIFMRGTQNEVIIQLPVYTKLDPILGEHRWPEFLQNLDGPNRSKVASYIFEYNYRNNGEPGNHNWSDFFATSELPPSWFPVKFPYPRAHYADAAYFSHLRNLILPLPKMREPTPPDLKKDEEPPANLTAYPKPDPDSKVEDQAIKKAKIEEVEPAIKPEHDNSEQKPLFVEKYDPYEEEELALQGLRSINAKQEHVDVGIVKQEDYQASAALIESLETLSQNRPMPNSQAPIPAVKKEEDTSDYEASEALIRAIQQHQSLLQPTSGQTTDSAVKTEANDSPSSLLVPTRHLPDIARDPRRRASNTVGKRPKEEDSDASYSLKRVKTERTL